MSRRTIHARRSLIWASGFTLIEVLAVVFLMTLVLGVMLNFYIDLSNASTRASEKIRVIRRSAALLDRIAADFERVVLVSKPGDVDPLAHPWIFLAEPSRSATGSDRIKFIARRSESRRSEGPVFDVERVAYTLHLNENSDAYELRRWSAPGLSEGLDRDFPFPDDPASLMMADGVAEFSVRFRSESGNWIESWDSSQLLQSGDLPISIEIELALKSPNEFSDESSESYRRRVMLPMRPIDLTEAFDPATYDPTLTAGADEGEDDGLMLAECVDFGMLEAQSGGVVAGLSPSVAEEIQRIKDDPNTPFAPYAEYLKGNPAVREHCQ